MTVVEAEIAVKNVDQALISRHWFIGNGAHLLKTTVEADLLQITGGSIGFWRNFFPGKGFFKYSSAIIGLMILNCGITMDFREMSREKKIQNYILDREKKGDYPGIQYVAVSQESLLLDFSAGSADRKAGRIVESKTTMMAYSMTKTFTAAAILQLVDEGKISLDDPVSNYLEYNPFGKELTIRHLLSQTSGIPNPIPLKWVHLAEGSGDFHEKTELLRILADNPSLEFKPGKKYSYSNLSYWLLGMIIERVSGVTYREYMQKNIFQRLGLTSTEIDFVIPDYSLHAKGYLKRFSMLNLLKSFLIDPQYIGENENGWVSFKNHYLNGPAFGGIVTSAKAISVFLQDQLREESVLFSTKTKRLFFEQQKNNAGDPIEMSLGWHIRELDGIRYFYKEGGGGGFHSEMRIYPSKKSATVVIVNNTTFATNKFLDDVDGELLK